jgi:hypothetical protein
MFPGSIHATDKSENRFPGSGWTKPSQTTRSSHISKFGPAGASIWIDNIESKISDSKNEYYRSLKGTNPAKRPSTGGFFFSAFKPLINSGDLLSSEALTGRNQHFQHLVRRVGSTSLHRETGPRLQFYPSPDRTAVGMQRAHR